jgi:hypothetical protein
LVEIAVVGIILLKISGRSERVIRSEIVVLELTGGLETVICVIWSAITVFAPVPRIIMSFFAVKRRGLHG